MIALQILDYFPHFYSSHFRFMIMCFEHRLSETNNRPYSYFQHFSTTRTNIKGTSFDDFQCFCFVFSNFSFIIFKHGLDLILKIYFRFAGFLAGFEKMYLLELILKIYSRFAGFCWVWINVAVGFDLVQICWVWETGLYLKLTHPPG